MDGAGQVSRVAAADDPRTPARGRGVRPSRETTDLLRTLQPLWDADASGWFVYDPDGRLAYANPAIERLTGSRPVPGSTALIPDVVPESQLALQRTLRRLRSGGSRDLVRLTLPAVVGDRLAVLRLLLLPFPHAGGAGCWVVGLVTPPTPRFEESPDDDVACRMQALERVVARIRCELASVVTDADPAVPAEGLMELSGREQEVLELLADGARAATIADALHVSIHTVRNHTKAIFRKLGVHSQAELMSRMNPTRGRAPAHLPAPPHA